MIKLYPTTLHNATSTFRKQFLLQGILLALMLHPGTFLYSQCVPPPAPVVTPNPAFMCVGDAGVKLKVIQQPFTPTFCSGVVNIPVPDNDPAGSSNSINVSIPATCQVNEVRVAINMQHTRIGDMVFVLRAPNGQVLNLDHKLSSTGGSGATTGFFNTIISMVGTVALGTGTNPYTGTFKADAQTGLTSGPTGMIPTTTNWVNLLSVPSGTWTLGFYDAVSSQTGTLNSWCLSFVYSCSPGTVNTPATWTPFTGLFYDPAGIAPYTGLPVDSVWARPTPAGTYTYQVTTQGIPGPCSSPATNLVVNVGVPSVITSQPTDQYVCLGSNAQFTVAVTNGLSYNWQQSSNGGATWTNLANAFPYSGINTASLTITAPTLTMNGYRYRVIINGGAGCGGAISNAAVLYVNPLPTVTIWALPTNEILPGETATLFSSVTPNPAATYTWTRDGIVVPGANADTLLVDFSGLGDYQLSVTDIKGCSGLSNIVKIKDTAGKMFIYPNPNTGRFLLRMYSQPNTTVPLTISAYNNMGLRVLTQSYTQTVSYQSIEVDLRRYGKGFFWVEVLDRNNKRISMTKVLVQ